MKEIFLTQGQVVLVDEEDFVALSRFRWSALPGGGTQYAKRTVRREDGRETTEQMHRRIMGAPSGMDVDHINHDGLDNRRENLRVVTRRQNSQNLRGKPDCSSKYPGVSWVKALSKWEAQAQVDGKKKHLGRFASEFEAARAYGCFVASLTPVCIRLVTP